MKNWASYQGKMVKSGEGFLVVYDPPVDPVKIALAEAMGMKPPAEAKEPITAICRNKEAFILRGDHKQAYDSLAENGWEACFAYYTANLSQRASISTDAKREMRCKHLN